MPPPYPPGRMDLLRHRLLGRVQPGVTSPKIQRRIPCSLCGGGVDNVASARSHFSTYPFCGISASAENATPLGI
jgi:hypothetical protein